MLLRAARIAAPRLVAARPALRRAVPPAVVAGISFSIYQSLTTFHALALNMEAPPPSPLQVSGEAVLNADPALGGANVLVAPEQEESDDGLDEEQYDDAWQVLELQDRVRSDLFTHDGIVIGFGKAGSLLAGKVHDRGGIRAREKAGAALGRKFRESFAKFAGRGAKERNESLPFSNESPI